MKAKCVTPTGRSLARFEYFSACIDEYRLTPIPLDPDGYSAAECFHAHETFGGELLPCREPILLTRALNGKRWHGVTIEAIATDYVDRIFFAADFNSYPEWVRLEILALAAKIASERLGFVPGFIKTGVDFSNGAA